MSLEGGANRHRERRELRFLSKREVRGFPRAPLADLSSISAAVAALDVALGFFFRPQLSASSFGYSGRKQSPL
jgi:hypothetical protein